MENKYFYLSDFKPKFDEKKNAFYFSLGKVQKFLTDGVYGVWEMSKEKIKNMINNFKNNVTGYDIIGYEAEDHLKYPRENLVKLSDLIFDENKNELIGEVIPLNEKAKEKLLSGVHQITSPEFIENYQDKRTGKRVGATLTGFLFTSKTYQPDLTPSYALSDNIETKLQFLKNLTPQEAGKMELEKLLSEKEADNKKLLSEKQTLEKNLSDKESEIKTLSEKNKSISAELKTLSEKIKAQESAAYAEKVEKLLSDNSKGESVKILAAEIEPLKKLLSDPNTFESVKAMIDARQPIKLSDITEGTGAGAAKKDLLTIAKEQQPHKFKK